MADPRFLTPADVADLLATSVAQVMALLRSGELRGIQIGGRNQWRVEVTELEAYIQRQYAKFDAEHSRNADDREALEADQR